MKEMKVRLTFIEEILGTASNDKELHAEYIASKAPDAISKKEEIEAIGVEGVIEKGKTVFPKDENGNPKVMYDDPKRVAKAKDVQPKEEPAKKAEKCTTIDNLIFVNERKILLQIPEGKEMGNCQRPLRAQTPQGERVALANSDSCPEGTVIEFTVMSMVDDLMDNVEMWLDYGKLNGIGQWHNSGKGRFVWEKLDKKGKVIGGNKED